MKSARVCLFVLLFMMMLVAQVISGEPAPEKNTRDDDTHVYAMRYGQSRFKLKNIYASEKKSSQTVEFVWLFYLVTTRDQKILIDTGFSDAQKAEYYHIRNMIHPTELLLKLGIKPDDITNVILTHKHFDHSGLAYLYTKANIYIQAEDYQSLLDQQISRPDTNNTRFFNSCPLLCVLTTDHSISPALKINRSGGHTIGSQIVTLKTSNKTIIFTGDECYFIEGCEKEKTNSLAESTDNNRNILKRLKKAIQTDSAIILTGHDPVICHSYPQIHENIFQIQ
ncbi:MAG: MBL fold metallo-hydrolase [Pseudomonadota bacterium]